MNAIEIDRILRQTLTDFRISPTEKKSLSEWLATLHNDHNAVALVRSRAFDIARQETLEPGTKALLGWLEDVVKLLDRPDPRLPTALSQAYFSPGSECVSEVIRQFHTVKSNCDVCVFTITDDRIAEAILEAFRRGVAIRVITDDEKSLDLGSDVQRLADAGIPVKLDHTPYHMHHKFAVFDHTRLLTGSFNWTRSAAEHNEENLIVTADPTLVNAFVHRFQRLWAKLETA